MIEIDSLRELGKQVFECMETDKELLEEIRSEIRPLRDQCHTIKERNTTSISMVGTDGGNNSVQFDPYLVHIIRVVDSSNNEYCMEVLTPTTPMSKLHKRHFDSSGKALTPFGEMMVSLGVDTISDLSPMIPKDTRSGPVNPSWVKVYRELTEWAVLLKIARKDYGTDTVILFDGLLRSKVFSHGLFRNYLDLLMKTIESQKNRKRNVYIAGLAKHSKVLNRYRLAMTLENILSSSYPEYVEIPRALEEKSYVWSEYAKGVYDQDAGSEQYDFTGGKMFFVKFGKRHFDFVWPLDILYSQAKDAQVIIGSLYNDAIAGFPIAFYPLSLQKAHENAALVDFDYTILQDNIINGIRASLGDDKDKLDSFVIQEQDPSRVRYE